MPYKRVEDFKANRSKYRKANRSKINGYNLKWRNMARFKLSSEDYAALLHKQGGVCAICKCKETYKNKFRLTVDHDHLTNLVRGLLCARCNSLLGFAKDSILVLESAIRYLRSLDGRPFIFTA